MVILKRSPRIIPDMRMVKAKFLRNAKRPIRIARGISNFKISISEEKFYLKEG